MMSDIIHADEDLSRGLREESGHCLVCTTSWQEAMTSHLKFDYRHVIGPSVKTKVESQDKERVVAWAGDPRDGSLAFLIAVANGIRRRGDVEPFVVKAFPDYDVGPEVADAVGESDEIIVGASPLDIENALASAKVYAAPSLAPTSFDMAAATAACHGAMVVAPRKYGYPETFGRLGALLCVHSYDNAEYAMSFAATLVEALSSDLPYEQLAVAAKSAFNPDHAKFSMNELRGFLRAVSKTPPTD